MTKYPLIVYFSVVLCSFFHFSFTWNEAEDTTLKLEKKIISISCENEFTAVKRLSYCLTGRSEIKFENMIVKEPVQDRKMIRVILVRALLNFYSLLMPCSSVHGLRVLFQWFVFKGVAS